MLRLGLNFFFYFASFAVLVPYLPLFFKARGYPPSQIGLLMGCFGVAGIIGPLIISPLVDRTGRFRSVLFLFLLLSMICMLPLELVSRFPLHLLFVFFLGMCFKAVIPLLDALALHALTDPRVQYGRARMLGSAGFIASALVLQATGWIDGTSSRTILIVFLVTAIIYTGVSLFLPKSGPPGRERKAIGSNWAEFDLEFWLIITMVFLTWLGMTAHYSFFSLFAQEVLGLKRISFFWAIATATEIPFILFSGPLIRRFGFRVLLAMSIATVILRLGLYSLAPSVVASIAAQLLHGINFGVLHAVMVDMINRRIKNNRALAMAVYFSAGMGLAAFVGPIVGGFVLEAFGYRILFGSFTLAPALALLLLLLRWKHLAPNTRKRGNKCI